MEDNGTGCINCRTLTLVTNGLADGTKVFIDDKVMENVKSCHINFDKENTRVDITLEEISKNTVNFRVLSFEGGTQ